MAVTVKTNNHPRFLIDAWELSTDERKQFDYLDWDSIERGEDSATFFRYRGELHDLGEFSIVCQEKNSPLSQWDAFRSDSFFDGLAIKFVDSSYDSVIIAHYYE